MLNRTALLFVAGAATFALSASAASAQDTTRKARPTSTKRIPVVKTTPGEVTMRVDTVTTTVYRTDTLQLPGRVDTVTTTRTLVRVDTVTKLIPLTIPRIGGFYIGVGVGSSLPAANFNDSDHPGWKIEVPLGYDQLDSFWGVRFNVGYSNYSPHDWMARELDNAQLWNFDGDVKLRFISGTPHQTRISLYGVAGGTYNNYKDILETNHDGILSVGDAVGRFGVAPVVPDLGWHSGWGWNAGAGVEAGKGQTNVFLESRFNRFSGEHSTISHVPIVLGVTWYYRGRDYQPAQP